MALNGIAHKELTDPQLHELKGASTAQAGQVPFADGEGHTSWRSIHAADIADAIMVPDPTSSVGKLLTNDGYNALWANSFSGNYTFTGNISLGSGATATTPAVSDNSTKVATTDYINSKFLAVQELPQVTNPDTFYFILES